MSPGKPAKEMDPGRPPGDRMMLEGDIMVTAVGEHYAIGRLRTDRDTQEPLGWRQDRAAALEKACALAGSNHRVFLYEKPSHTTYLPFGCAKVSE